MQQQNHDDSNAPFSSFQPQQQWGYGQPQYSPQQNGVQIIVNLPPNNFPQQPQAYVAGSRHFDQDPHQQQPDSNHYQQNQPYQGNNIDDHQPLKHNDDDPASNRYGSNQESAKSSSNSSDTASGYDSRIRKFLTFLLFFFIIANFVIIIKLLVYHFGHKDVTLISVGGALEYIGNNLSADPILEIRVRDDTGSCDSGYETVSLGTWPGTVAGCDYPSTGLKKGACNKSGKNPPDLDCTDIEPRSPIDMTSWGGSYWCVKRAKLGTQYTKSVECESGFRQCSVGICVLSSLNCPVTFVDIQAWGTYKMRIGADRYVVTSNTFGAEPVVDLAITPNDIPCFSGASYVAGPTAPYKLINANERGCSKYGKDDRNSFQIDQMTQDNLFSQNDFPSQVMNLPHYDATYDNTFSVLSYRLRISVAEKDLCLTIDTDLLEESSSGAGQLNKFMTRTSIAAIVIHIILVITVGVVIGIKKQQGKSWDEILQAKGEAKVWSYFCTGFGFLEYIALIVMFATVRHYKSVMEATEEYLGELDSLECFLDSQPQEAVADYQVAVDVVAGSLYQYALILFLVTTFTVLPSIYLVFKNVKY